MAEDQFDKIPENENDDELTLGEVAARINTNFQKTLGLFPQRNPDTDTLNEEDLPEEDALAYWRRMAAALPNRVPGTVQAIVANDDDEGGTGFPFKYGNVASSAPQALSATVVPKNPSKTSVQAPDDSINYLITVSGGTPPYTLEPTLTKPAGASGAIGYDLQASPNWDLYVAGISGAASNGPYGLTFLIKDATLTAITKELTFQSTGHV